MPVTLTLGAHTFENPLFLAPMEDVSTGPFRRACRRFGADVVYTEFVHARTLVSGTRESADKLELSPEERPVAVQLFGEDPDAFAAATDFLAGVRPDFIDVNIGCPVRKVVCRGAGAALLKDLALTERIVRAVVARAEVPVTAKARIGWDEGSINVLELARMLEANGVAALAVHARTRAQGYGGRADWRWIAAVKSAVGIPVIGNGDVFDAADAARLFDVTGCDGIMVGRAAIARPWVFGRWKHALRTGERLPDPPWSERVAGLLEQLDAEAHRKGEARAVREMRSQYVPFLRDHPERRALRKALVAARDVAEVRGCLETVARAVSATDALEVAGA